jgi:hypothetical protein
MSRGRDSSIAFLVLTLLLLQLFAPSCGKERGAGERDIPFTTLEKGLHNYFAYEVTGGANTPPIFEVIVDEEGWRDFYRTLYPPEYVKDIPPAPAMDFGRELVIAAFQGVKPTGGYSIEITAIKGAGSTINVYLNMVEPLPRDIVTQVFTSPYHIVKVSRDDLGERGEVKFSFWSSSRQHLAVVAVTI